MENCNKILAKYGIEFLRKRIEMSKGLRLAGHNLLQACRKEGKLWNLMNRENYKYPESAPGNHIYLTVESGSMFVVDGRFMERVVICISKSGCINRPIDYKYLCNVHWNEREDSAPIQQGPSTAPRQETATSTASSSRARPRVPSDPDEEMDRDFVQLGRDMEPPNNNQSIINKRCVAVGVKRKKNDKKTKSPDNKRLAKSRVQPSVVAEEERNRLSLSKSKQKRSRVPSSSALCSTGAVNTVLIHSEPTPKPAQLSEGLLGRATTEPIPEVVNLEDEEVDDDDADLLGDMPIVDGT